MRGCEDVLVTNKCPRCKSPSYVEVPPDVYDRWREGMLIQVAWPTATADQRETLMTGYHDACYDLDTLPPKNFGEDDE